MRKQQHLQPAPNRPRLLPLAALLLGIGNAGAAVTTTPPVVDTEPPTNITINAPAPGTPPPSRPVITLDMATEVASSVVATDAASAGSPSTDIPGFPTGKIGPLAPGRHTITWSATDLGNNSFSKDQIIDVRPEVNFGVDQTVGEGNTNVTVTAYLSGTAPIYPVTLPYTINAASTATGGGVDHTAPASGNIVITAPNTSGSISFSVINDAPLIDPDETIIFDLDTAAFQGDRVIKNCATCKNSHTITIKEGNLAPIITISATQGGIPTHAVMSDAGEVTLSASVKDPNGDPSSGYGYDWSASDNTLVPTGGTTSSTFKFNPAGLTPGILTARLTVSDGKGAASTRDMQLRVYATAPTLSATDDSDDDGISDSVEGLKDSDGDGIPDYLDAVSNPAWLPGWDLLTYKADLKRSDTFVSGPITFAWKLNTVSSNRVYYPLLLATQAGLKLSIGPTAFANSSNHARIDTAAASLHFGSTLPANLVSADGKVVDIEISGLGTTGQSVYLVIPQAAPLPTGSPRFKVMGANRSWQDFVNEGDGAGRKNTLLAANKGSDNYCPPPASSDINGINGYAAVTAGSNALNSGVSCVELLIEDGGPNDYDGQPNGIIRLLGAPFVTANAAGDGGTTTPPEFNGTATGSVESLNKIALSDGGGGVGFIGAWGVLGLLLAHGWRRRQ